MLSSSQIEQLDRRLKELIAAEQFDGNAIPQIRLLLETLYKNQTQGLNVSFSDLFGRMQYIHKQEGFPAHLSTQANILRIYCNRVLHGEQVPQRKDILSAYHAITCLIEHASVQKTAGSITDFLKLNQAEPFPAMKHSAKASFSCLVEDWFLDTKKSPNSLCIKAISELGEDLSILLICDNKEGRNWALLDKALWPFAMLNCVSLTAVQGRENHYMSNPETLIVLEPDFLIDASSLAECFCDSSYHPEFFILNKFISETSSEKSVQGKTVNAVFDELVLDPQADYVSLFKKALAQQPISMLSLGLETTTRIFNNIQTTHLSQLQNTVMQLEQAEIQLEPSYVCPEYGLQGRIDLLAQIAGKYSVLELKSGTAPVANVWKQQQMQVVAYNMIIKASYGAGRVANCSILYSESKDNPLRNVTSCTALEQNLIMCRNRIVGLLHRLSEEPKQFFDWITSSNIKYPVQFMDARFHQFKTVLASLQDFEYEWFLHQVRFVIREVWYNKTGSSGQRQNSIYGYNRLWRQSKMAKQSDYELLPDLKVISFDQSKIRMALSGAELISNFRVSDTIVLYDSSVPVFKQEILRGVIQSLGCTEIEINIRGGLKNYKRFSQDRLWAIEHDLLESSLYSPLSSVFAFLGSEPGKRELILGQRKPASNLASTSENGSESMEALVKSLQSSSDYSIIQGPPGTGKTSALLCNYVKAVFTDSEKRVLILSFTNRAVDEICFGLDKIDLPYLRTGNSKTVVDKLLNRQIEGRKYQEIMTVIQDSRIWVSTIQSCNAWYLDLLNIIRFDELIIDEASQVIEPAVLGIISRIPKLILIGDQNQLPPIIVQPDLKIEPNNPLLKELGFDVFRQSILERLHFRTSQKGWTNCFFMLHRQFRMHKEIADLVADNYDNKLVPATERQFKGLTICQNITSSSRETSATLLSDDDWNAMVNERIIWLDTPPAKAVRYDPIQVSLLIQLLDILCTCAIVDEPSRQVGIIAPFRAMIHAIQRDLPQQYSGITIDTVERFQGSEREIMLITLPLQVREDLMLIEALNRNESIDRKLNVALSRARERIIIIGSTEICSSSPHYRKLIDRLRQQNKLLNIKT